MTGVALVLALTLSQTDDSEWPPRAPTPAPAKAKPAAKEPQTILVLDLTSGPDVPPNLPRTLSDQLAVQVRQSNPDARVLGMEDVRSMMALQAQRSRLNCQDVSCLAEIGGALGAKEVVNGSISRIGSNYVLTVKRVNAKQVKVLADSTQQIPRDHEQDLIPALRTNVQKLFPSNVVPTADDLFGEEEVPTVTRSHTNAYLLMGAAAVGVAALITGAVLYQGFQNDKNSALSSPVPVTQVTSDQQLAVIGTVLVFAGATIATGGAAGALLTW